MREIVVISGKGGTGKTTVSAAFAHLAENKVICDLDVDAPDLHILLDPKARETHAFVSGHKAEIRHDACLSCGKCAALCAFDAISLNNDGYAVDPLRCEGCGVCAHLCPAKAIDFEEQHCGDWQISDTRFGPMVHALLFPGQENSGKLVSLLKSEGAGPRHRALRRLARRGLSGHILAFRRKPGRGRGGTHPVRPTRLSAGGGSVPSFPRAARRHHQQGGPQRKRGRRHGRRMRSAGRRPPRPTAFRSGGHPRHGGAQGPHRIRQPRGKQTEGHVVGPSESERASLKGASTTVFRRLS